MDCYTPKFDDPYPRREWEEITDVAYLTALELYRDKDALKMRGGQGDADYVVSRPYSIGFKLDGEERTITVPRGMLTDLASVPSLARSVVGRVGRHLEASIVHDFLYIAWQDLPGGEPRREDRRFADELMLAAMECAKVRGFRRQVIYRAVRAFGWPAYAGRNPGCRYVVMPGWDGPVEEAVPADANVARLIA